jgi:hypothetical protein
MHFWHEHVRIGIEPHEPTGPGATCEPRPIQIAVSRPPQF